MSQENCPYCGRFTETFDTESGAKVQVCEGQADGHVCIFYFPNKKDGQECPESTGSLQSS